MDRQEWLLKRKLGIGASEASAITGDNPYMSNIDLWEYKVGMKEQKDISEKSYVKYGTESEEPMRTLFALDYPQYNVEYNQFELVRNADYPFIFATLDGKLIRRADQMPGVLEIKKAELSNMAQRLKWKGKIPQNYYIQIVHQLLATGWSYAYLKAKLISTDENGEVKAEIRHIKILREEILSDIDYLLEKEIKFWECVTNGKRPSLVLPDIG